MFYNNYLFEISWEVCNKVGGIHTVISSKIKEVNKHFNNYFLIGPYKGEFQEEFIKEDPPENYLKIFYNLEQKGIKIHYGCWNVDLKPKVFLIEYKNYSENINDIKKSIWEIGNVDSLNSDWYDFDEVMLWSWCTGIFIEEFTKNLNEKVLVHSHEWMSGGSIFYFKTLNNSNKFKTIYTTHATMLGRSLSGQGHNLYEIENEINPDEKAIEIGVKTKHQTEKALANISDAFTTVSDITNDEAEIFYKKKANHILYNGYNDFNLDLINNNFSLLHKRSREKFNEFLNKYFQRFYDINVENIKIFFTSGRNEFLTKGIDIYIKSLSKLNDILKQNENSKEIVALILIPMGNFKVDEELLNYSNDNNDNKSNQSQYASLSTHILPMDNHYIKTLIENNLRNHINDKVKVIINPVYLNGNDGIFNMSYYDCILGYDLGIFASFYEPWGYTPLECIYYGIPTVTTNLTGFGRYILKNYNNEKVVKILDRQNSNKKEVIDDLSNYMFDFLKESEDNILAEKTRSKIFAKNFRWEEFYKNYLKVYSNLLDK